MIFCGLKLTHDGAIALIEDNKLLFCIEMEKLNNNPRYTAVEETELISTVLAGQGYGIADIDYFAVDGWGGTDQDALALQPRLEIGERCNRLLVKSSGKWFKLDVAPYREKTLKHDVLEEWSFQGLEIGGHRPDYSGYLHVAGHIMSAYCSSDFAAAGESAYILIWDGGMYPRLYFFDPGTREVENLGPLFLLIGNIYTIFAQHFGPFKVDGPFAKDNLSVAGKVMAYVALGEVRRELFRHFDDIYVSCYDKPMGFANIFANELKKRIQGQTWSDEDILASFHLYLEELLTRKLEKKVQRSGSRSGNLCMAGGCALNIKWNSAVRDSGIFQRVYTPPFPNDSGSALGMACCGMVKRGRHIALDWNVYSGPDIGENGVAGGWSSRPCSLKELAALIHRCNSPVVVLNGKAELGPRALGNRSILANAGCPGMKDRLNRIKNRESYRPVSPICLESKAPLVFDPGTPDPYMLFDHRVRSQWSAKIPAVLHLDGTARLQTVSRQQNPVIAELLREYEELTGIPLLCNTSANFKGSGFFPDVYSATRWDGTDYVWCDNKLYEKERKASPGDE
jgi:carbamoyltransferase